MRSEVLPDQLVEEGNLTRNDSTWRKGLGESQNNHRYIVTIRGVAMAALTAGRRHKRDA